MFFLKKKKKKNDKIDYNRLPKHVAVIPDGNRRYAKKNHMPKKMGHKEGSDALKEIVKHCDRLGIKYLSCYIFSTENWKREKQEIDELMNLLYNFLDNAKKELEGTKVRIIVTGKLEMLSRKLVDKIKKVEDMTRNETGVVMNICLNYGSRDEIINAVKEMVEDSKNRKIKEEDINEKMFARYLYTKGIPDPDLLIRTSDEKRLSNFMLWQMAYTELYFSKKYWPEFTVEDFEEAIIDYQKRIRRFGGE